MDLKSVSRPGRVVSREVHLIAPNAHRLRATSLHMKRQAVGSPTACRAYLRGVLLGFLLAKPRAASGASSCSCAFDAHCLPRATG